MISMLFRRDEIDGWRLIDSIGVGIVATVAAATILAMLAIVGYSLVIGY